MLARKMSAVDSNSPVGKTSDKKGQSPAPPSLDEAQINAPSMQTLIMLGVISLATLLMWAAGRAACNYHVEGESLTPRAVPLEGRTSTPKDVALEFAQNLSSADFETARKISVLAAVAAVSEAQKACGDCTAQRASKKQIFSVATVLRANNIDAIVQVRTVGAPGGEKIRIMGVERVARDWRVSRLYDSAAAAVLREPEPPPLPVTPGDAVDPAGTGASLGVQPGAEPGAETDPANGETQAEPGALAPSTRVVED